MQGCTFWGLRWYCSPLRGEISKTPIFGFVNRRFQAKQAKSWSFTLSKLPHRFQPNFAQRKRPPSSHRGWSQYVPNKSKMADGCQFEKKTVKCHISATVWPILKKFGMVAYSRSTIKVSNFRKSNMATAAILNITKNHDISAKVWPIFTKFGTKMQTANISEFYPQDGDKKRLA